MIYAISSQVLLPATPSLLFNNLSHDGVDKFCYIHLHDVVIVDSKCVSTRIPFTTDLYLATFVKISNQSYIAISSGSDLYLYSSNGRDLLHQYSLATSSIRGLAGGGSDSYLAIGTYSGEVLILDIPKSKESRQVTVKSVLSTDASKQIGCVVTSDRYIVGGNEEGDIFGFDSLEPFSTLFKFIGAHSPCTSLLVKGDVLVAAYTSGRIKIFRMNIQELAIEITAHAACINGLSIHGRDNLFASCGEDHYVHLWSLPSFESKPASAVELLSSAKVDQKLCTGLCFNSQHALLVASYDTAELQVLEAA